MLILPNEIMALLGVFAPVFSERVFEWAKVLVVDAILAPQKRTVSAVLRVMGLSDEAHPKLSSDAIACRWSGLSRGLAVDDRRAAAPRSYSAAFHRTLP